MAHGHTIHADRLLRFAAAAFQRAGLAPEDAQDAAHVLVWANLHGVDTHGVRNLKSYYIEPLLAGKLSPRPAYTVEHETPFSARVDAGNALGLLAGCWAMRLAIAKAEQVGLGMVTVRNTGHYGAAGFHASRALDHDMMGVSLSGFAFAQGNKYGVAPTFGRQGMLSTNPIAVAAPTAGDSPFLLDMATSVAPMNRVHMLRDLGIPVPAGWGLDGEGNPTTDGDALRTLFPLGGSRTLGGHKGYGLAMVVEILCGVLSGGWTLRPDGGGFQGFSQERDAHFFAAIRVDAFRPVEEFKRDLEGLLGAMRASTPAPGHEQVLVAGDPEHLAAQERSANGIPLPAHVVAELAELQEQLGIDGDFNE